MQQLVSLGNIPGLERIKALLTELGNPHQGLACVHIAGTNGKGTTSSIIADVLTAAGYKVGRFTSPHLHSYCERFVINGHEIQIERLQHYLDLIESKVRVMLAKGLSHPTEFEILTAIAFLYFKDESVDVAVMEVGMGGLFDSTNVIKPIVSIITGVDFDHTDYLGNNLEEIAYNKAGIIKSGVPVVVGAMHDKALKVIRNKALLEGSDLISGSQVRVSLAQKPDLSGQVVNIEGLGFHLHKVGFSLLGNYQLQNLSTALAAISVLRDKAYYIDDNDIRNSLSRLNMPGRLEVISKTPLVIGDVAHNPQGAMALAESLETILPGRQKVLVIGVLNDKDRENIISPLGKNTRVCVMTRPEGLRSNNWKELKNIWNKLFPGCASYEIESIQDAVVKGLQLMKESDYMIITGSFYVLNQARSFFVNT